MNNFNDIKGIWDSQAGTSSSSVPQELVERIKSNNRLINDKHIATIIILTATLVGIVVGFGILIDLAILVPKIGLAIMVLSLAIRIVLEVVSYYKKKNLDFVQRSDNFRKSLILYFNWRKQLHGAATLSIVVGYIIGVSMLFVGFYQYFSAFWFYFFAIQFIVMAVILTVFIQKQIKKEIKALTELIELYKD